jgi:hypothetical protein
MLVKRLALGRKWLFVWQYVFRDAFLFGMFLVKANNIKGGIMTKKAGPKSALRIRKSRRVIFLVGSFVSLFALWSADSFAVPVFARKYHTACSTCHLAFPVRNGFGEAFRNNGYRFPNDADDEMIKEEPVTLGQEAYKNVFPNAIWPSDLPNMPSLGFLAQASVSVSKDKDSEKYKDTAFDEELGIFFAGTVTHHISYFGDFALNSEAATLGRLVLLWSFKPGVNLALGDVGFPELFTSVSARPNGDKDSYSTSLPNPNRGVELRIAGNTGACGGYSFLAGIGRNSSPLDDEHGGNFFDTRYVRATYKIGGNGLLSGVGGTIGIPAIGMDNSVTIGLNYVNSDKGGVPSTADLALNGRTRNAYGADIMANYGSFRAIAQYSRFNEVVDEFGQDWGKRTALGLEGDYWVYPWLYGVIRYEKIDDNLNGKISKVIPGVAALLRANAKIGLEYVVVTKDDLAEVNSPEGNSLTLFAQLGF